MLNVLFACVVAWMKMKTSHCLQFVLYRIASCVCDYRVAAVRTFSCVSVFVSACRLHRLHVYVLHITIMDGNALYLLVTHKLGTYENIQIRALKHRRNHTRTQPQLAGDQRE